MKKYAYYIGFLMRGSLIATGIYLSSFTLLDMVGPRWSIVIALAALLYWSIADALASLESE